MFVADNVILYDAHNQAREIDYVTTKRPILFMSGTKSIVGLLIGHLVDIGRLRLADRVSKYIPEYKHPVRISHLLDHTSGIDHTWNAGSGSSAAACKLTTDVDK